MNYTPEDYVQFYNDQVRRENARHGVLWVLALIALVTLFVVVGCDSRAQDAEIMQMAKDKSEEVPPQAYFQFPLPYTATVTQCDTKKACRTHYYVPRSK